MKSFVSLLCLTAIAIVSGQEPKRLAVGDTIPDVTLRTDKDADFKLRDAVKAKPAVIIFYRGGWCPYCSKHLSSLAGIEKDLASAGVQLLAISADQPTKLRERPEQKKLSYTLLSDSTMTGAKAFGIAFQVPDNIVHRYKTAFNLDLETESGQFHHLLPHPAVYVVDKSGVIRFAHVNQDYKVRLEADKVLEAAKAVH